MKSSIILVNNWYFYCFFHKRSVCDVLLHMILYLDLNTRRLNKFDAYCTFKIYIASLGFVEEKGKTSGKQNSSINPIRKISNSIHKLARFVFRRGAHQRSAMSIHNDKYIRVILICDTYTHSYLF